MNQSDKLWHRMRRNPAGDWTIADVERLCAAMGFVCLAPTGGGSHWKIAAPGLDAILTIPARRPIKPIYIRQFIELAQEAGYGQTETD